MKGTFLWLKDDLNIPELKIYEGVGIPTTQGRLDRLERWKGTMNIEGLINLAKIFNTHYEAMGNEILKLEDEDAREAIYEDYEEEVSSSMAGIIIEWAYAINPELCRIEITPKKSKR